MVSLPSFIQVFLSPKYKARRLDDSPIVGVRGPDDISWLATSRPAAHPGGAWRHRAAGIL